VTEDYRIAIQRDQGMGEASYFHRIGVDLWAIASRLFRRTPTRDVDQRGVPPAWRTDPARVQGVGNLSKRSRTCALYGANDRDYFRGALVCSINNFGDRLLNAPHSTVLNYYFVISSHAGR
jgi:hypothetical protein